MCMVSAVMDEFRPYIPPREFPKVYPGGPHEAPPKQWSLNPPGRQEIKLDPQQLQELIDAFREAVQAAAAFDRITGQPDCVDPEKAKLEDRVEELEDQLEQIKNAAGEVL